MNLSRLHFLRSEQTCASNQQQRAASAKHGKAISSFDLDCDWLKKTARVLRLVTAICTRLEPITELIKHESN